MKTSRAFTLVELIIVITILAILATIAFISYEGYTSSARDSKRMSETSLLYKGLSVAYIKSSKYPEETNMASIMSGASITLAKQSKIGKMLGSFLGASNNLFSSASNYSDYTYTLNPSRSKAQVTSFLEKGDQATATMQSGSITKYLFSKGDSIPVLLASATYEPTGGNASESIDITLAANPVVAFVGVSNTGTLITYTTPTDLVTNLPTLYASGYVSGTGGVSTPAFACGTSTVTGRSPDTTVYHTVVGADGKCWLASNLGTANIATAYNDSTAYGWLYQWGRLTDNHQIPTSGTATSQSTTDIPGHANFIKGYTDWRSTQNDTLSTIWGGVNGTSSPCPVDWRIPTQSEWGILASSGSITNRTTAFSSSLKLTTAGLRYQYDGALNDQGSVWYYWSSSPNGYESYSLVFDSSGVLSAYTRVRALGFSVRCLKN